MNKISKILACTTMLFSLAACNGTNGGQDEPVEDDKEKAEQLRFEEEYISNNSTYDEGGKFASSVIESIGKIAGGSVFKSPGTIISGIFSLLGTIGDNFFFESGPSSATILNRLAEMDGKLDVINEKLDKNYNQLATESVRTQAMVDQVLLEEQEQAISAFNTQYVEKIRDFQRNYADYIEQSYKAFVNQEQTVEVYVNKENDEWYYVPLMDRERIEGHKIEVQLKEFTNAKAFLKENYNTVTKGFMDKFSKDIDSNLSSIALPDGLKKDELKNFIGADIVESFTKKYYEEHHDKTLEIRNLAINYAKQINGKSTKSILDRYFNRMKYMFNFAGETKTFVTGSFANIAHQLDVNAAIAAQACLYSGTNQDEIRQEFIDAREKVKSYYKSVKDLKDGYCFLTNTNVTGALYRAMYNTSFTNKGNHPDFHVEFSLEDVNVHRAGNYEKTDIAKHKFLADVDHLRIATRYGLLRENGLTKSDSYIKYLVEVKALPQSAWDSYEKLHKENWIPDDALRFFTGMTSRGMNGSDKFQIECQAIGNPGGNYFSVGWKGTFKGGHSSDCWSGTVSETTYIDANTGKIMSDKKVAAYARYSENHWYWSNDEFWSFVDNIMGNYFFSLEHVVETK